MQAMRGEFNKKREETNLGMEGIVDTHVIHIVTKGGNEEDKDVKVVHHFSQGAHTNVGVDGLGYIKCMCKVVISILSSNTISTFFLSLLFSSFPSHSI